MNFLQTAASAFTILIASVTLGLIGLFHFPQHSVSQHFDTGPKGVTNSSQQILVEATTTDCMNGRPLYDSRGQITNTTITATHVYAHVWDGTASNNSCGSYTLPNADPKTFRALNEFYAVDKNTVWFIDDPVDEGGPEFYQIVGADPSTFALIFDPYLDDLSYGYTKDKNHVYYFGRIVLGADPATFTIVDPPGSNFRCPFIDAQDAGGKYYRGGNSSIDCTAYR